MSSECIEKQLEQQEPETNRILIILGDFEKNGFYFYPAWTTSEPRTPDRIQLPSKKIKDLDEIDNYLASHKPLFGKTNIELKDHYRALEYYNLIRNLSVDIRTQNFQASFRDEQDIEDCKIKYDSKIKCN